MSRLRFPLVGVLALVLLLSLGSSGREGIAYQATPDLPSPVQGPAHLGGDLPGDPAIQLVQVAAGLQNPVNIAIPPDGSGRLFVVAVDGAISVINPDGSVNPEPFLDLSSTVALRPGQQGLLGLAFHPDYAANGRFYVAFNNLFRNGALSISEFRVSDDDPAKADVKTERPLLVIEKPYPQHNGGTLRFGPDGYLYISTGDGGWQGDPYDNAQSRFSLLGKILRIDVDSAAAGQPYGIPADNPFAGPGRYDNPYPGAPRTMVTRSGAATGTAAIRSPPRTAGFSPRFARRSGRSDFAIPGSLPSTRKPAISTSATSAPGTGRRSTSSPPT